jgi:putative transposase
LTKKKIVGVAAPARKDTPMLTIVTDEPTRAECASGLDEILREGARRMLAVALEAEVAAYIDTHAGVVDEDGKRLVVRLS